MLQKHCVRNETNDERFNNHDGVAQTIMKSLKGCNPIVSRKRNIKFVL